MNDLQDLRHLSEKLLLREPISIGGIQVFFHYECIVTH